MVSDYSHLIKHFSDHELPRDDEAFDTGEEQEVNRVRRRRLAGGADGQLDEGRAPLSVRNLRGISEVLGVYILNAMRTIIQKFYWLVNLEKITSCS